VHPGAKVTPGVLVYRLDDRLFFANAGYVRGRIREAIAGSPTRVRWCVFDAQAVSHIDATGVDALRELIGSLQEDDITFVVARLSSPMRESFGDASLLDLVGMHHVYPTVRDAVDAARAALEED
jgi:MFS superfamily sulfate permease-like transporter